MNMKKIFLSLFILSSLASSAQIDSTKIPQTVTLSLDKVCYIKQCLGNNGDVAYVKFYKQVSDQMDTVYNAAQPITLTVTSEFIVACYVAVSNTPERLGNPINDEISNALLPQLTNAWLLGRLQSITAQTVAQRAQMIQSGFQYFKQIK